MFLANLVASYPVPFRFALFGGSFLYVAIGTKLLLERSIPRYCIHLLLSVVFLFASTGQLVSLAKLVASIPGSGEGPEFHAGILLGAIGALYLVTEWIYVASRFRTKKLLLIAVWLETGALGARFGTTYLESSFQANASHRDGIAMVVVLIAVFCLVVFRTGTFYSRLTREMQPARPEKGVFLGDRVDGERLEKMLDSTVPTPCRQERPRKVPEFLLRGISVISAINCLLGMMRMEYFDPHFIVLGLLTVMGSYFGIRALISEVFVFGNDRYSLEREKNMFLFVTGAALLHAVVGNVVFFSFLFWS